MNPYFDIARAWNGTSQRLGKQRSYHPTISVNDEPERQRKASHQDELVLQAILSSTGPHTASYIHSILRTTVLITSIRRSLNTLLRLGNVRKVGVKNGPRGHIELIWTAA